MSSADSEFDSQLLDLHLGRLTSAEQAALQERIDGDPDLAAQNEALTIMFQALGSLRRQPGMPAGLTQKIAARVAAAGPRPRVVRPVRRSTLQIAEESNHAGVIRLHTFREIAAVAAIIVLAVGVGVPSMLHMRERGQRIVCSQNLANIGRGMQSYALANNYSLPFAGWNTSRNTWQPTSDPGLSVLPNHRHAYVLLRSGYLPARVFVCPSSHGLPMRDDQVRFHNDFLEPCNVSYAYQNMAGVRPSLRDDPDLPALSDDNPLFDNGFPLFEAVRGLGLGDPAKANSRAHGGAGQNILTIRGTVKWVTTPNAGINGDNIWTLQGVGDDDYTGREGPQTSTDAHLLK